MLSAPNKARAISVLTALWQALSKLKVGSARAKKVLGIPSSSTIVDFEAIPVTAPHIKPKKLKLIQSDAQHGTLVQFLAALVNSQNKPRDLETANPISAVAEGVKALKLKKRKSANFADFDTNLQTLKIASTKASLTLEESQLTSLADGATKLNILIAQHPDQLSTILVARVCFLSSLELFLFDFSHCFGPLPVPDITTIPDKFSRTPTPILSGSAATSAIYVRIYRDGRPVETVPVINGSWSYTSPNLPNGSYIFSVVAIDPEGKLGAFFPGIPVTVQATGIWDSSLWDRAWWGN